MIAAARRRTVACGALMLSTFLAGCAGSPPPRTAASSQAPVGLPGMQSLPRSERGNPPFYDVLGKRYHVLATSDGYDARGVASWYGRDFHGLATSSGETYDMHAMTAAHTTLPIPTWVEVTNLTNGKRVVVKVNDRGPFVANRLIDLSYAAAVELDMVRAGTTRVEVRALHGTATPPVTTTVAANGAPSGVPVAPADVLAPPAAVVRDDRLFVQVGAFAERENAVRLVDQLKASGFSNSFVVSDEQGRRTLHRVRLGPLRDAQEFDLVSGRLQSLGVGDTRLVVDR